MEPFCSTTLGSEISYQCQTGVLPEERITLLCGEGKMEGAQVKIYLAYLLVITLQFVFLDFISVPANNLSTSTVIAITAVICQLVASLLKLLSMSM